MHKASIVAIVKNESTYLLEWLAFHLVQGFSHFTLFNNNSTDSSAAILRAIKQAYSIEYMDWQEKFSVEGQCQQYTQAARQLVGRTEFVAMIDVDEFVGNINRKGMVDALNAFGPEVSAIAMNQRVFGSSRQATFSPDLVIDRFVWRNIDISSEHYWCKVMARPERIDYFGSPHCVTINQGTYVLQDGQQVATAQTGIAEKIAVCDFKLHHYMLKSREEFEQKQHRWGYHTNENSVSSRYDPGYFDNRDSAHNVFFDNTFCQFSAQTKAVIYELYSCLSGEPRIQSELKSFYSFLH